MSKRAFDYESYSGDYQYRAIVSGHPIQSFWHRKRVEAALLDVPAQPTHTVVDVGCGSGVFSFAFAERAKIVIGLDVSRYAVEFCNRHKLGSHRSNCEFLLLRPSKSLPMDARSADIVVLAEVIEHLTADASFQLLREIRRVLKADGVLYVTTPNYASLWPIIETALDASGKVPPLKGQQHIQKFKPELLEALLERAGFIVSALSTFFVVSPFLAPMSPKAADAMFALEKRLDWLPGMILSVLCTKRT